jgi:two-component system C4-dicarboxylate transport sensor histidine kinase DctB
MPAAAHLVNLLRAGRWPRRRLALWAVLLLGCLLLAGAVYRYAEDAAIGRLRLSGAQRLDTHAASLEHLLSKYDFLPGTFELNRDVIALLQRPGDEAVRTEVNTYLERVNRLAGSTSIYIVNLQGVTQAASNWREPDSFVGDNVAFRPYVRDALRGEPGGFYGVGTTRGEPGYYFARGVYHDGRMLGVATVKVNIENLEGSWAEAGGKVLLSDAHGVVFLSSVPEWKYRTLAPLAPAVRQELEQSRQYVSHPLTPLGLRQVRALDSGARIVAGPAPAAGGAMLSQSRSLVTRNWQLVYLSDLAPARASARAAALLTLLSEALTIMLVLYARQRHRLGRQQLRAREDLQRAYDNLESLVAERTASLQQMTRHLRDENIVRRQAEQQLRKAQSELVQAGKMAMLGQLPRADRARSPRRCPRQPDDHLATGRAHGPAHGPAAPVRAQGRRDAERGAGGRRRLGGPVPGRAPGRAGARRVPHVDAPPEPARAVRQQPAAAGPGQPVQQCAGRDGNGRQHAAPARRRRRARR